MEILFRPAALFISGVHSMQEGNESTCIARDEDGTL
jgi:hypothetical protein